ncbi:Hypothetical protein PFR_JS25-2_44 [Propionibacterium freudenreichii]|nr:Hypothetical protein PFR_JS25-2_44 [Propionibacterium freudenreichii]
MVVWVLVVMVVVPSGWGRAVPEGVARRWCQAAARAAVVAVAFRLRSHLMAGRVSSVSVKWWPVIWWMRRAAMAATPSASCRVAGRRGV